MTTHPQQQAQVLPGDDVAEQGAARRELGRQQLPPQAPVAWPAVPDFSQPRRAASGALAPAPAPAPALASALAPTPTSAPAPAPGPAPVPAHAYTPVQPQRLPLQQAPIEFPQAPPAAVMHAHVAHAPAPAGSPAAHGGLGTPIATMAQQPMHVPATMHQANGTPVAPTQPQLAGPQHRQSPAAPALSSTVPAASALVSQRPHAAAAVAAAVAPLGYKTRLRWENIFPLLTLIALATAIVLFASNWRAIMGREQTTAAKTAQTGTTATTAAGGGVIAPAPAATGSGTAATNGKLTPTMLTSRMAEARTLMAAGRYDEADLIVHPLATQAPKDAAVAALRARLTLLEKRNAHLLNLLGQQSATGNWTGLLATVAAIQKLHPLLPAQIKLRDLATAKLGARRLPVTPPATGSVGATTAGGGGSPHSTSTVTTPQPTPTPAPATTGASTPPPGGSSGPTGPPPTPGVPDPTAHQGGNVA